MGGGNIEQKRERTQGHRQQCGDWGGLKIEVSISGINGHGKIVKIYSEIYLFIRYY